MRFILVSGKSEDEAERTIGCSVFKAWWARIDVGQQ